VNGGTELAVGVQYWDGQSDASRQGAGVHVLDAETGEQRRSFPHDGCGWELRAPESAFDTVLLAEGSPPEFGAAHGCALSNAEQDDTDPLYWFDTLTGAATSLGPGSPGDWRDVLVDRAPAADRQLVVRPVPRDHPLAAEAFSLATVEDLATGDVLMEAGVFETLAVALSSDGATVAIGGTQGFSNGAILLIDVATGEPRSLLEGHPGGNVNALFFVHGGRRLVSTDTNGRVRIWQLGETDRLVESIQTGDATVGEAALSADARRLALFSVDHARVVALDSADLAEVGVIATCDGDTELNLNTGLVVAGDQVLTRSLCAGEGSGAWQVIRDEVFDYPSGERRAMLTDRGGQAGRLSPSGRFVADQVSIPPSVGAPQGMTGSVTVTDLENGAEVAMEGLCAGNFDDGSFETDCAAPPAEPYALMSSAIRFSPNGRQVVVGADPRYGPAPGRVWDAGTGATLGSWRFAGMAFSPDGSAIATFSPRDQLLEIRETDQFTVLASRPTGRAEELYDLAFDADATTLIAVRLRDVFFYDAETLAPVGDPILGAHDAPIRHMEISDDRTMIATAGADGFVRVWSTETRELLHEISVIAGDRVQAVAFANDDKHVLATAAVGPVRIYTLDDEELLDVARRRVLREFTSGECERYFPDHPCPTLAEMRSA
jgi:WD40 repeat protein